MIRGTAASTSFKEEQPESDLPKPSYPPQTQIVRLAAPSTSNGTRVVKNTNSPQQLRVFHHKNGKLVSLANTNITPGHNPGTWLHNGKPITIVFDKPGAKSVQNPQVRPVNGVSVVNGQSPVGIKKSPQFINGRMVNNQNMGMPHSVQPGYTVKSSPGNVQQGYTVKSSPSPRQLPQHPQVYRGECHVPTSLLVYYFAFRHRDIGTQRDTQGRAGTNLWKLLKFGNFFRQKLQNC